MSDITMCQGQDCPLRESCYRYTATPNEYRQAYFYASPRELSLPGEACIEFVSNGAMMEAREK